MLTLPPVSDRPHREVVEHSFTSAQVADSPVPEDVKPVPQVHV
jgi:hypothetical protein